MGAVATKGTSILINELGGCGGGVMTTEGISILINESEMGALTTEGISILINESGGGCRDNKRYFNTN